MEYRDLPVPLTDAEILLKSDQLATKLTERNEMELERKGANKDMKEQIARVEENIDLLRREVKHRQEVRPVPCHEDMDHQRKMVALIRSDTGELVSTRAMTESERQVRLFEPTGKTVKDATGWIKEETIPPKRPSK
jgi:hypothetical protein